MKAIYQPTKYKRRKPAIHAVLKKVELRQRTQQGAKNLALFGNKLLAEKPFKNEKYANHGTILC